MNSLLDSMSLFYRHRCVQGRILRILFPLDLILTILFLAFHLDPSIWCLSLSWVFYLHLYEICYNAWNHPWGNGIYFILVLFLVLLFDLNRLELLHFLKFFHSVLLKSHKLFRGWEAILMFGRMVLELYVFLAGKLYGVNFNDSVRIHFNLVSQTRYNAIFLLKRNLINFQS